MRFLIAGAAVFVGLFQLPSTPPMKMGLWEQTSVMHMKMTGAKMPPGMPTDQTTKTRSCYTPETWTRILTNNINKSCTISNQSVTGSHLSLDLSCANMAMKMHFDGVFPTTETGHGTVHMEMNTPQMSMVGDSTFESHFVSSDCGSLAGGKSEIVR
jgi:hypothetical protein